MPLFVFRFEGVQLLNRLGIEFGYLVLNLLNACFEIRDLLFHDFQYFVRQRGFQGIVLIFDARYLASEALRVGVQLREKSLFLIRQGGGNLGF